MGKYQLFSFWQRFTAVFFSAILLAALGGCGGGGGSPSSVINPPPPPPPATVSVFPAVAQVYSRTPTTLTISGGVAPFRAFSSNSAALPIDQNVNGNTIVLLPADVAADTQTIVTVQDSIGQTGTSTVTVRPAPLFNSLTITPNITACGTNAVCSGQTARAAVTVSGAGGAGIPNRQVKFDVVSGQFSIQTNDPANPLVSTLTVTSDATGVAQVLLKALTDAATQPALVRATDLTTGNQVTASFSIVQNTNGATILTVIPPTATITAQFKDQCSSSFRVDYFIYGGTPPYRITSTFPASITLVNTTVNASGGFFEAITNGACVDPLTFSIVDATGRQTTATLQNLPGTQDRPAPVPVPSLAVTPASQTATSVPGSGTPPSPSTCPGPFGFVITGGSPPYNVTTSGGMLNSSMSQSTQVANNGGAFTVSNVPKGTTGISIVDLSTPAKTATATINCT